jgi:Domain of Unknown Function (DUF748)
MLRKSLKDCFSRRWAVVASGVVLVVILAVALLSYLLRRDALTSYVENQMNSRLSGYTVKVGRAHFSPIGLALELRDLTLAQEENPDPPVASIPRMRLSVHWRELLRIKAVGDVLIDRPSLHLNLKHLVKESESTVPLDEKGWQDAVQSIYPIKIDALDVKDGELTYIDRGDFTPLHARDINVHASNIRNISDPENAYPSPVRVTATIFDQGKLRIDGRANFLQKPHMAFKASMELSDIDLKYIEPITRRANVSLRKGIAGAVGDLEVAPQKTDVNLKTVELKGIDVNYIHRAETAAKEQEQKAAAAEKAKDLSGKPSTQIRIDEVRVVDSTLGYINRALEPDYRLFFAGVGGALKGFTNQTAEGVSRLDLTGKFMGTGDTKVAATFRPAAQRPNLELKAEIVNAQMASMTDMFKAHAKFDVSAGLFSFYTELSMNNDAVKGYVKPLFEDMRVTDLRDRNLIEKAYVAAAKVAAKVMESRRTQKVATVTDISGPLERPNASFGQALLNLLRNAFTSAILPGFREEARRAPRG